MNGQTLNEEAQQILAQLEEDTKHMMADMTGLLRLITAYNKLEVISQAVGISLMPHLADVYTGFEKEYPASVLFAIKAPQPEKGDGNTILLSGFSITGMVLIVFLQDSQPAPEAGKDAKPVVVIGLGDVKSAMAKLFSEVSVSDEDYLVVTTTCKDVADADKALVSTITNALADGLEGAIREVLGQFTETGSGTAVN